MPKSEWQTREEKEKQRFQKNEVTVVRVKNTRSGLDIRFQKCKYKTLKTEGKC